MDRYLSNVRAFQKMLGTSYDLPSSMRFLTIEGANAIEEVLAYADSYYTTYKESKEQVIDKVPLNWCYSGDVFAGEAAVVGVHRRRTDIVADDGAGNVEILSDNISVKGDGAGNVEITKAPSNWTVIDDGNGNIVIGG